MISRKLVVVRCRRKTHLVMTLVATDEGRMRVDIRHHPITVFGAGSRAGRFDLMVFAESEEDDPNCGPPITHDFHVGISYTGNCQCGQHVVPGDRLAAAVRNHEPRVFSAPG